MKQILEQLISELKANIIRDLHDDVVYLTTVARVLKCYNRYQENELDGVDYIFNICNSDDVACCLKGGMSVEQLVNMFNENKDGDATKFFFFGQNHTSPLQIQTFTQLVGILCDSLDDVIPYIIKYPSEGKEIYNAYIIDELV